MLVGSYNFSLVLWSVFVAILAGFTSLDMASRVSAARGTQASGWLIGGSLMLGLGIWAMHFVGMQAFSLPIPLGYDPVLVGGGLLLAVATSMAGYGVICNPNVSWPGLALSSALVAAGIAGLHFMAMSALGMQPGITYSPLWSGISILVAWLGAATSFWVAFYPHNLYKRQRWRCRVVAGVLMGLAIAGMHYAAMAAARFPLHSVSASAVTGFHNQSLTALTVLATVLVLAVALLVSLLEVRSQWHPGSTVRSAIGKLHHLAVHDALTGLPNRTLFEEHLDRALEKVRRDGGHFAVLMLDLDGFRVINDAYGHHVGDRLLLEVTHRVQSQLRGQDTLARLAGDEFVLMMAVDEPAEAATQAHKVLSFIKKPFYLVGHEIHVSASVGITLCPDNAAVRADLLAQADAARHHAKSSGRNTYSFFEASMQANVQQQLSLLQEFRKALENNELSLVYQPKLSVREVKVKGAEALLRWYHPRHGQVAPDQFIPLAERTGLIVPIGEWVLETACRQIRAWRDAGWADASVAVNLSPMQFRHSGLVTTVRMLLKRYGLEPASLTLEITESTAMHDTEASIAIMRRLHDLGVRLSIDDFGTGYSSLLYLKRLPVDELKIDRGFVRDLAPGTEDRAIVAAIAGLAQTLGLEIVAEGVETPMQFEVLSALSCHYLQGYLLGRPMTPEALFAMVSSDLAAIVRDDGQAAVRVAV
ncbi:MAG: bifunctional diguanylate cyclase/phosphodiesterase [Pusillimonas sp.]